MIGRSPRDGAQVGGAGIGHFVVVWRHAIKLIDSDSHLQGLKVHQRTFKALRVSIRVDFRFLFAYT